MITDPPDVSQSGFLSLIDRSVSMVADGRAYLGGSIPCHSQPGDAAEKMTAIPRFMVQMEGRLQFAFSQRGRRVDVELSPGQCLYLAPHAWSIEFRHRVGKTFGLVLYPECVRLIQLFYPPPPPGGLGTPWSYHTALPLAGAGLLVSRALDLLAEEGISEGASQLLVALLLAVRRHVRDDAPGRHAPGRAHMTWTAVRAYLDENFAHHLTRQSVGAALDLNPNYLSNLARHIAGQSFHQILETIRLEQAQRLLRESDLKLQRIALLCGYADTPSFAKAFRRVTGLTPGRFRRSAQGAPASTG